MSPLEQKGVDSKPSYERVKRHYSALRFKEALSALQEYVAQYPMKRQVYASELVDLGKAAYIQTQIEAGAKPALADLVEFVSIVSRYAMDQYKAAVPYAELAVELYPQSSEAYLTLARALSTSQQEERRCDAIRTAIRLGSRDPRVFYECGNCSIYNGKFSDAEQYFRQSLEVSSDTFIDAWEGLGYALASQSKIGEAIDALERYLQRSKVTGIRRVIVQGKIEKLKGAR
jgi:tetratricopeptide (TPR) repeat protein